MGNEITTETAWLEADDGRRFALKAAFSIGRSSSCDLSVTDTKVSRKHASIHMQGEDEYWISDLGSANGTRLNGNRLGQPARLRDGDKIEVGALVLRYRCPGEGPSGGATQLTTQQTLIELRREERWLLVADVEDSTMLASSIEPEVYKRYVDEWFRKARILIERERGAINKFLGDGFLACWPGDTEAGQGVANALAGFKAMRDELPFRFRVVVHYGDIVLGGLGSVGEESLSGPEVNYVFRMEKIAGTNGISVMLSEAAAAALGGRFSFEAAESHDVPGFGGRHRFHVG